MWSSKETRQQKEREVGRKLKKGGGGGGGRRISRISNKGGGPHKMREVRNFLPTMNVGNTFGLSNHYIHSKLF